MLDGAYVEICGNLKKDLVIKQTKTGRKYGILSVAVEKKIGLKSKSNLPNYKTHSYPVYIWDQVLLENQGPSYKKGERVLVIGELDAVNSKEGSSLGNDIADSKQTKSRMIINIKKNIGISLLPKEMFLNKTQDEPDIPPLPKENSRQPNLEELQLRAIAKNKTKYHRKQIKLFS